MVWFKLFDSLAQAVVYFAIHGGMLEIEILPGLTAAERLLALNPLLVVVGVANIVAMPLSGRIADAFGRKHLLVIRCVVELVQTMCYALVRDFKIYVVVEFFVGLTRGAVLMPTLLINDVMGHAQRLRFSSTTGTIQLIFTLLIAPASQFLLKIIGLRGVYLLSAALRLVLLAIAVIAVPETLPVKARRPLGSIGKAIYGCLFDAARLFPAICRVPHIAVMMVAHVICTLTAEVTGDASKAYQMDVLGWAGTTIGNYRAVLMVTNFVSELSVRRFLAPRLGVKKTCLWGLAVSMLRYATIALLAATTRHYVGSYVLAALAGVGGASMFQFMLDSMTMDVTATSEQGKLSAAMLTLSSLTATLQPILTRLLYPYIYTNNRPAQSIFWLGAGEQGLRTVAVLVATRILPLRAYVIASEKNK